MDNKIVSPSISDNIPPLNPVDIHHINEIKLNKFLPFIPIIVLVIILVGFGGYLLGKHSQQTFTEIKQKACTQEAKICSDGSSVGRTGPNCEFIPCSTVDSNSLNETTNKIKDWKIYKDEKDRFQFRYPSIWKIVPNDNTDSKFVQIYDPIYDNPTPPFQGMYGYIAISKEDKNSFTDIEKWFDDKYISKPGIPGTTAPTKNKIFTNKNGVEIIEANSMILYTNLINYFIGENNIISILTRNMDLSGKINNEFIPVYSQIIDSIEYY